MQVIGKILICVLLGFLVFSPLSPGDGGGPKVWGQDSGDPVDFLGQLETGLAITKLQGRFFKPFPVKFPPCSIKKGIVADQDIKEKMKGFSPESRVVRPVRSDVKKEEIQIILTDIERGFLVDIARNPVFGVLARYERLGIIRYQGNKIQSELLNKELISWRPVSTKTGRLKVLVLTDKGKKAIPEVKIEKIFHKNSSWEHDTGNTESVNTTGRKDIK